MRKRLTGVFLICVGVVACGNGEDSAAASAPVGRAGVTIHYDAFSAGDEAFPTNAAAGGGMLAEVTDLEIGASGRVYVLDSKFKKVAVFSRSGDFERAILGGSGQGPGEFQHPTTMAVAADGAVAVFDYGQNRLTLFGENGAPVSHVVDLPRTRSLAIAEGNVWGSYFPGRQFLIWSLPVGQVDAPRSSSIDVDARQNAFYPRGEIAKLGRGRAGALLVASMRPGVWYDSSDTFSVPHGEELYPGELAFDVPGSTSQSAPAETVGIGYLEPGLVAIAYVEFNRDVRADEMQRTLGAAIINAYFVAVFSDSGEFLGKARLDTDNLSAFAVDASSDAVFFAKYTPFPRVARATLEVTEARQ